MDFEYTIENNAVTIHKYIGKGENVIIPCEIEGKSVTTIGNEAFRSCTTIKSVTIPDCVTKIGSSAFSGCKALTSMTRPSSAAEMGFLAFGASKPRVVIPDSVTQIGVGVFKNCDCYVRYKGLTYDPYDTKDFYEDPYFELCNVINNGL